MASNPRPRLVAIPGKTLEESIDDALDDPKLRARLKRWARELVVDGDAGALFVRLDVKNRRVRGASVGAEEPRSRGGGETTS